jgi:hypothetical protein
MTIEPAMLKSEQAAMTPEAWDINKDCRLKKRDHKWQWKYDPLTNETSPELAVCVHCGIEVNLNRDDMQQVAKP